MEKLSENFEIEMARREAPKCYGEHKGVSEKNPNKCGLCWFAHNCKVNKPLNKKDIAKKDPVIIPKENPVSTETKVTSQKENDEKKNGNLFNRKGK